MTDRERLLKILNVPIHPHENVDPLEAVADFLLDNGVTFHKWVPVVLGFLPDEKDVAEYIEKYSYAPEFIVMIQGSCEATTLQYDGELWSDEYGNAGCIRWQDIKSTVAHRIAKKELPLVTELASGTKNNGVNLMKPMLNEIKRTISIPV